MLKTATNIIKGVFRHRKSVKHNFKKISWIREKILKHNEDQSIKQIDLGHFSIKYKRPYEFLHTYREIFENEIYCFTTDNSAPLIIDCGSNIGMSILYFKQIYPGARILAFEPDPGNFSLLQQNVQKNHLQNIELNQAAVWISDGTISFASNDSEASHISDDPGGQTVRSISLNHLLNRFDSVDFLKIDIEGAEMEVIRDSKANLVKVKNLFLEYHGKVEETHKLNELLHIVHLAGFQVYIRNAADNVRHPFVEKRTHTVYDVQLNLFCYK